MARQQGPKEIVVASAKRTVGRHGQVKDNALARLYESALAAYAERPALRCVAIAAFSIAAIHRPDLAPLAVGLQASDTYLISRRELTRANRGAELVKDLEAEGFDLTVEEVNTDTFAQCFSHVAEAVVRSDDRQKNLDLARMTCKYRGIVWGSDADTFEEMVRIRDGLSRREWQTLLVLSDYEQSHERPADVGPSQWAVDFWPRFQAEIVSLGVPEEEVFGFVSKLARTGLFVFYDLFDDGDQGFGHTTPYLDKLRAIVARSV